MKLKVCAVWDAAVQAFNKPMFVMHTAAAVRAFGDMVNASDDNPLAMHPEDYELHLVGEWDEESGVFDNIEGDKDVVLVRGKDAKKA